MNNIRILQFAPSQNMQHLYQLRPDLRMLIWLAGYDKHGKWTASLAQSALTKYPLGLKKKKKNAPPHTGSSQNTPPASKNTTSKKNTGASRSSVSSPSHRVLRRFQLNLTHAMQETPDRLFCAFFVAYDGHCLFTAFKEALQVETSIQELRNQVVREISEETDAAIRISALNTHIAREADHHNPRWQDVELLDAGTVFVPGEMDVQFSHLWVQYAEDMSGNAWAGTQFSLKFIHFYKFILIPIFMN